jgi:phage host-nuclease inhibitor protein Gam
MTTQKKDPIPVEHINTLEDVENVFNRIQFLRAQLATMDAKANKEIATARTRILTGAGTIEEEILQLETKLEKYTESNRKTLFTGDKKSIELRGGTLKVTSSPGKVVLAKNRMFQHMKDVIKAIKKKKWSDVLTTPDPDLDKNKLKKMYESDELNDADLAAVGLKIEKEEKFSYELNTVQ